MSDSVSSSEADDPQLIAIALLCRLLEASEALVSALAQEVREDES